MSHQLEDLSSTKKKINFTIPTELVDEAYKNAYKVIRKKANLKGFRKGKIPNEVLDKMYAPDLNMESVNFVINQTYPQALQEYKLVPLLDPKFDVKPLDKNKEYQYSVEFEVKPEFEVQDYEGIKIKKKEAKVTAKEIDQEIEKLQQSHAELKAVSEDKVLDNNLVATIDFIGTIDGEPFPQGQASNYVLEYGKGHFLPDFETQIKGMKKSEVKVINVTFPKDYHNQELQNKTAEFTVTLQGLHEKVPPKLDDDFAKDLGHDNLGELKSAIEKRLIDHQNNLHEQEYAKEAMDHLIKKNKFEIPEAVLELEMKEGKKDKEEAEKSIRGQFILEEIAKKEDIKVEPTDLETRFNELARVYQQPVQVIKKYYQENRMLPQLVGQMTLQKTLDFVVSKATLK